ncbi:group III truncated hemoglobin [Robertkochia marina]|uniref:Group III truncated hemoglobin n=1 Tax=Robertkochia marina TaxID=1227945 RepID=A0A4S3M3B0_9FLAO|nr:group III truncated hemoglobin [Robertkochia marina]THD69179.1 group III truncated hemoglobin [Robertkochia marina]TRZ47562.1 group III truncated hemoglobin [Robertkochia marina]
MNHKKHDIASREDVQLLVHRFYDRIRNHEALGPFFNSTVQNWAEHLELLTNFWDSQLFLNRNYTGDPVKAHIHVDKVFGHTITMEHFGWWLEVWVATIDDLFDGERAWIAKNRARKMATMLFLKIYESRKTSS